MNGRVKGYFWRHHLVSFPPLSYPFPLSVISFPPSFISFSSPSYSFPLPHQLLSSRSSSLLPLHSYSFFYPSLFLPYFLLPSFLLHLFLLLLLFLLPFIFCLISSYAPLFPSFLCWLSSVLSLYSSHFSCQLLIPFLYEVRVFIFIQSQARHSGFWTLNDTVYIFLWIGRLRILFSLPFPPLLFLPFLPLFTPVFSLPLHFLPLPSPQSANNELYKMYGKSMYQ